MEDPKWELAILATVQGFYEKLLQESLEGEVPVPAGLETISLQQGDVSDTLERMRLWLRLLDMAITPAMLRGAFTADTDPEIAEALLRYLVRTKDGSDRNRDKTDLVATFLYRHPRVPGQWERRGFGLDGSLPLAPFEIALIEILADSDVPSLPEEHVQLLRRFDGLQREIRDFSDFNTLLDSGVILRVRELKQLLEMSFYHPGVLATIAPYNAAFGRRFDELFRDAASEIRNFARLLQEQGGTILGNVDGVDVTVEHVEALEESELLRVDYGVALEKFRRVSRLKRTLEQNPPVRRSPTVTKTMRGGRAQAAAAAAPAPLRRPPLDVAALRQSLTPTQQSAEETKLRKVEESIRVFVRVADPKFRQVVPMRFFNLTLTPAEVEAYSADYLQEKSLRAGTARILLRSVALVARLTTELEDMKRQENSASLWKLHADSLIALLELTDTLTRQAERVVELANQHAGSEYAESIRISLGKLHDRSSVVFSTLTSGR